MKFVICAIAATLLWTESTTAEGVPEPEVPDFIARAVENDKDRAVDNFAKRMLDVDPDGNLSEEAITKHAIRARAVFRAAELERFLIHDLNLDGVLSAEEIIDLKRYNKASRRPDSQIVFRVLKADRNGDGRLSLEEMTGTIIAETDDLSLYMRQTKDLHKLLFFDQDKDGIVTLEEMLQGVQTLSVPCDC